MVLIAVVPAVLVSACDRETPAPTSVPSPLPATATPIPSPLSLTATPLPSPAANRRAREFALATDHNPTPTRVADCHARSFALASAADCRAGAPPTPLADITTDRGGDARPTLHHGVEESALMKMAVTQGVYPDGRSLGTVVRALGAA